MISGLDKIFSTFPKVKQKVTSIAKPRVPFRTAVHIIASGNIREASLISSDMCVAESGPMKEKTGESIPIRQDRPMLPQLPPSVNWVNTAEAVLRGARTQSGTKMAKKPQMCSTRTIPSTNGSRFAR